MRRISDGDWLEYSVLAVMLNIETTYHMKPFSECNTHCTRSNALYSESLVVDVLTIKKNTFVLMRAHRARGGGQTCLYSHALIARSDPFTDLYAPHAYSSTWFRIFTTIIRFD